MTQLYVNNTRGRSKNTERKEENLKYKKTLEFVIIDIHSRIKTSKVQKVKMKDELECSKEGLIPSLQKFSLTAASDRY